MSKPTSGNLFWAQVQIVALTLKVQPHLETVIKPSDIMERWTPKMRNVRYCVQQAHRKPVSDGVPLTQHEQRDLARAWDYMQKQDRVMSKERFAR